VKLVGFPGWSTAANEASAGPPTIQPATTHVATEELILIETYLHRRYDLGPAVRFDTASRIAERVKAKTGLEPQVGTSVDDFLETAARQIRDGAQFR
jgi:hypothetical protein